VRLRGRGHEAAIAFAFVVSGLAYAIFPAYRDLSVVGRTAPHLALVWNLILLYGGLATLVGMLAGRLMLKVTGLLATTAGLSLSAACIIVVDSPIPVGARLVSASILMALAVASANRVFEISWGRHI
jgi:hypothetical protein